MPTNFYMFFVVALFPLLVGAIYYNPKVFGGAWMRVNGFTEESLSGGNMAVIFGLSYLFSVMIALLLSGMVIHQGAVAQVMMTAPGEWSPEAAAQVNGIMEQYGNAFRGFGHGAIHGFLVSLLFVLPIIAINALFERRGGKYIFIHFGYWAITLILMGGVLCQTLVYAPVVATP